ncbi:DNA recombination protein RmuC [Aliidiomarina soli]|uniref:DNA recombination protein RmuC n=1 Tax=Aliidiomarina soli TaxID=1928574 RepID=A0A432WH10_9GAMM|nr:DNA recombination protein RmuC [Aliidiomarina soli]RUO33116.1 DNA recombination protein RmuC [Aliidiomarina soli]
MELSSPVWLLALAAVTAFALGAGVYGLWNLKPKRLLEARYDELARRFEAQQDELREAQHYQQQLQVKLASTRTQSEQIKQHADEKISLLQRSEERLEKEFERLAGRILEQTSAQFNKRNQETLSHTLAPLRQQIDTFRQQVSQQFNDETKERASLKQELNQLRQLNQQMASEAQALTMALKGDNKQQGNWGEVVLGRMLDQSGLREGHEYTTQRQHRDEEGKSFKPDVVVHLPNDKDVVIDSKVSLTAYERYFNSDDESMREQAMQQHLQSLRQHIKELGKKNYQSLDGVRTLDYVLLFIPLEPAFLLAVDKDPELISLALDNNIMLVSPTNLLVALRTVHNIWQYEYQNQNAQRIAEDAARLYDKFVGFVEDMQKVRGALQNSEKHLDSAFNKLAEGRGNIISRVEKFRAMGVQPNKRLPQTPDIDEAD